MKRVLFNLLAGMSTACFALRAVSGVWYTYSFYNSSRYAINVAAAASSHVPYHPFVKPTAIYFAEELLWSILPAAWLMDRLKRKRVMSENRCNSCGRDLRATPDRCPECGTVSNTQKEQAPA
jgi:hypothetical protein